MFAPYENNCVFYKRRSLIAKNGKIMYLQVKNCLRDFSQRSTDTCALVGICRLTLRDQQMAKNLPNDRGGDCIFSQKMTILTFLRIQSSQTCSLNKDQRKHGGNPIK